MRVLPKNVIYGISGLFLSKRQNKLKSSFSAESDAPGEAKLNHKKTIKKKDVNCLI